MKQLRQILIDGDILVYRAACAAQKMHYVASFLDGSPDIEYDIGVKKVDVLGDLKWKARPESYTLSKQLVGENVSHAIYNAKSMLTNIRKEIELIYPDSHNLFKIFLTSDDKSNYRFKIAKTKPYKGNRTDPKPIHYDAVRQYLVEAQGAEMIYGQEADDEMGIIQCEHPEASCIVSIDKDLKMIPGHNYNFVTKTRIIVDPEKDDDIYQLCYQLLRGDTVDNIPGLPGIGDMRARNLLAEPENGVELFEVVRERYDNDEYLLEQLQLLWIRRKRDELINLDSIKEYLNDSKE